MAQKVADLAALKTAQDGDYVERVVRGQLKRLTRRGLDPEGNLITTSEIIVRSPIISGSVPPEAVPDELAGVLLYLFSDPKSKKSRPYFHLNGELYPGIMPGDISNEFYEEFEVNAVLSSVAPTIDPTQKPDWIFWVRNKDRFEIYNWFIKEEGGVETYHLIRRPISYTLSPEGALQAHDSLDLTQA